jgi:hypothetical protein
MVPKDFDVDHGDSYDACFGEGVANYFFHYSFQVGDGNSGNFLNGWIALFSYCSDQARLDFGAEFGLYGGVVSENFEPPGDCSRSGVMCSDYEAEDLCKSVIWERF